TVSTALQGVKDALSGSDIEAIKTSTESLMTASQGFSQRLYEQASQSAATDGAASSSEQESSDAADDEVVDAEIVDEK
ncbi:MAG TPA: molecular chaperone DnaK, partial [Acidimicrobiales bacterium]|nr:molecular chaperone DnaK [Acidimicrobiales bacterium]